MGQFFPLKKIFLLFACFQTIWGPFAEAETWATLHDFKEPLSNQGPIPQAKAKKILETLFPRFLKSPDQCSPTALKKLLPGEMRKSVCFAIVNPASGRPRFPECMAEVAVPQQALDLKTGNFIPSVKGLVEGSFNGPGHQDQVAFVEIAPCSGGEPVFKIFTLSNQKVVQEQTYALAKLRDYSPLSMSWKVQDVNHDGIDEILMERAYYLTMAQWQYDADLLVMKNGEWKSVAAFPSVFTSNCEAYTPDESYTAARIQYISSALGAFPKFQMDSKTYSCSGEK